MRAIETGSVSQQENWCSGSTNDKGVLSLSSSEPKFMDAGELFFPITTTSGNRKRWSPSGHTVTGCSNGQLMHFLLLGEE